MATASTGRYSSARSCTYLYTIDRYLILIKCDYCLHLMVTPRHWYTATHRWAPRHFLPSALGPAHPCADCNNSQSSTWLRAGKILWWPLSQFSWKRYAEYKDGVEYWWEDWFFWLLGEIVGLLQDQFQILYLFFIQPGLRTTAGSPVFFLCLSRLVSF